MNTHLNVLPAGGARFLLTMYSCGSRLDQLAAVSLLYCRLHGMGVEEKENEETRGRAEDEDARNLP